MDGLGACLITGHRSRAGSFQKASRPTPALSRIPTRFSPQTAINPLGPALRLLDQRNRLAQVAKPFDSRRSCSAQHERRGKITFFTTHDPQTTWRIPDEPAHEESCKHERSSATPFGLHLHPLFLPPFLRRPETNRANLPQGCVNALGLRNNHNSNNLGLWERRC